MKLFRNIVHEFVACFYQLFYNYCINFYFITLFIISTSMYNMIPFIFKMFYQFIIFRYF